MWFQIELPQETEVSGVVLDSAGSSRDSPRGYKIEASSDGKTWSKPLTEGKGNKPIIEVSFKPTKAKFLKITQTGSVGGLYWSIHDLQVYGKAK